MSDFERSYAMTFLIMETVELYWRPMFYQGEIRMMEVWNLKYPN